MPRIWYRGGPAATAILVVAPIGNTTVLLLLSLTLELALALMLVRERRQRRGWPRHLRRSRTERRFT
jgi:hypothetical protein